MHPTHNYCLLCNSSNLKTLSRYDKDYLVKCKSCEFIFCKRIPTSDELTAHYQKYTRGGYVSPITIKRYKELLDKFESYRKTNNILDIGCGDGYFLEVAQLMGWNVYGTEYTDEAIAICSQKGISIHQGVLNPDNYKGIEFDVITSFEVIEHIYNPQSELQNIKNILRSKGVFYFTTPNFNSISRYILGPKWSVIEYPEHLSYYTPNTINAFFTKNGFTKLYIETIGVTIKRWENTVKNNHENFLSANIEEKLRTKIENKWVYSTTKKLINAILNILDMGDAMKGFYQKNY